MAKKDIIAISNALTDVIFPATDEEIKKLNSGKLSFADLEEIVNFSDRNIKIIPGGSPANVAANASYKGAKCGLIFVVGRDKIGDDYRQDLARNGVEEISTRMRFEKSGVCYTLISKNGERHFSAYPGASRQFFIESEEKRKILEYKLLHTSGHELRTDRERIVEAVKFAKENNTIVSFNLASVNAVKSEIERNPREYIDFLSYADIVFANEEEAEELGEVYIKGTFSQYGVFIKTLGEKGSQVYYKDSKIWIKSFPCKKINDNGAGDAYAAGFLVSYLRKIQNHNELNFGDLVDCGFSGSVLAAKVCEIPGARLCVEKSGAAEYGRRLTASHYHFWKSTLPTVIRP